MAGGGVPRPVRLDPVTPDAAWLWRQVDALRVTRGLTWTDLAVSVGLPAWGLDQPHRLTSEMPRLPVRLALWRLAPRTVAAWRAVQPLPAGVAGLPRVVQQTARLQLDGWLTTAEMAARLGLGRSHWNSVLLGRAGESRLPLLYWHLVATLPEVRVYRDRAQERVWRLADWGAERAARRQALAVMGEAEVHLATAWWPRGELARQQRLINEVGAHHLDRSTLTEVA